MLTMLTVAVHITSITTRVFKDVIKDFIATQLEGRAHKTGAYSVCIAPLFKERYRLSMRALTSLSLSPLLSLLASTTFKVKVKHIKLLSEDI